MPNRFLQQIDWWLPTLLRQKAVESASESRLVFIGASDVSTFLSDYILTQIAESPNSCWTACELDQLPDAEILAATGINMDLLAAGFIGAVIELSRWQGEDGYEYLVVNGVPPEDAKEFTAAIEVVTEKLGARGQALIHRADQATAQPQPAG